MFRIFFVYVDDLIFLPSYRCFIWDNQNIFQITFFALVRHIHLHFILQHIKFTFVKIHFTEKKIVLYKHKTLLYPYLLVYSRTKWIIWVFLCVCVCKALTFNLFYHLIEIYHSKSHIQLYVMCVVTMTFKNVINWQPGRFCPFVLEDVHEIRNV